MNNDFPFDRFCDSLRFITSTKQFLKEKRIAELISKFKQTGENTFELMRLLLPQFEKRNYKIKEKVMGEIYMKLLGLDLDSEDAKSLLIYKNPGSNYHKPMFDTGKFIEQLKRIIHKRMPTKEPLKTITIKDVNFQLDLLANTSTREEKEQIFRYFYKYCTLEEQIWICRIILKDLRLGVTERTILPCLHPDAYSFFLVNTDLQALCSVCQNPAIRINSFPISIFQPFLPMLSSRYSDELFDKFYASNPFWVETKLDGERMQMHMNNGEFKWYSRNSTDYSEMYGTNFTNGALVPFIHKSFKAGVTACILDGEMIAYNTALQRFEPFGTLKSAANEVLQGVSEKGLQPCFVVFDVLLINTRSLRDISLEKRFAYLEKVIVNNDESRLLIQKHQTCHTKAEIMASLEQHLFDNEEGIMIKNPSSLYKPGDKNQDWLKLKPDFISSAADDLDLVIVGGYYGRNSRAGRLASFLCAIRDDSRSDLHYISFCKFGTGFTMDYLPKVSLESDGNWKPMDINNPPDWLDLPVAKDTPDMILHPTQSHVVQVRGTQLIESTSFPTGITVRFPRFVRLRSEEKSVNDVMTKTELISYFNANNGAMQSKLFEDNEREHVRKKTKTVKTFHQPLLDGTDISKIEKKSDVFKGLEFCVMAKTLATDGNLSKPEIERDIATHGGTFTQIPTAKTFVIITDNLTVRSSSQKGRYDIVKSGFIKDCIAAGEVVPLLAKHILHATESTQHRFRDLFDKYGDSYTDNVDMNSLKAIFDSMTIPSFLSYVSWSPGPVFDEYFHFKLEVADLFQLPEFENDTTQFLAPLLFYLDYDKIVRLSNDLGVDTADCEFWTSSDKERHVMNASWKILECDIRRYGGIIVDRITDKTSFIITVGSRVSVFNNIQKAAGFVTRRLSVISRQWIEDCIKKKTILNEDEYRF